MSIQEATASIQTVTPRRSRLGRQRQVITVLSRHGFGMLVRRSAMPLPNRIRPRGGPLSLRMALEELGTTFIKLGQILSTRSDILPDDYLQALATLQDHVPPIGEAEVRAVIISELGAPPETLFSQFDPVPLATASIGQVHAATLLTGEPVVVKVQKPGITQEVELDLLILRDLARLAAGRIDAPVLKNLEGAVEQFADTLRDELDYLREGRNAERFGRNFAGEQRLRVPRIYWDRTTQKVLTMERLYGAKITDTSALARMTVERTALARDLAGLVLRQVFEHGFFHADPHPGNYFVLDGGVIGVVDFGMMGTLDEETRRELLLLLVAWVEGDAESLADGLMVLGVARGSSGQAQLRGDMRRVLGRYHEARLADLNVGRILGDVLRLARRHHLALRGDLAMMAKTLAMHEGVGQRLDPQFDLVRAARPTVEAAIRRLYLPRLDPQAVAMNARALFELTANFPQRAQRLLGRLERGDLGLAVRPEGVEPLMRDLNRMVNRLSVSILAAAFIVGLALLLQVVQNSHGSLLLLGLFASGLMAAGILGLWLLISMYQAGRSRE